jgi:hypothetical protein
MYLQAFFAAHNLTDLGSGHLLMRKDRAYASNTQCPPWDKMQGLTNYSLLETRN